MEAGEVFLGGGGEGRGSQSIPELALLGAASLCFKCE